jgi:protein TonB
MRWLRRSLALLAVCGFVALIAWIGMKLSHPSAGAKRQVAKIALLPDKPPPPPPPPPERPKLERKEQTQQQVERQRPEILPQAEQLKMEGQAGDGPSPFATGEVRNDYIGGDIGKGARYTAYAGRIAQQIQQDLARRNLRISNAQVLLWLQADGTVTRFEIRGANGESERVIRTAMAGLLRFSEAPPADMPMPMGLEISAR